MFRSPQINLYVADVSRSVLFYERLGFAETFRTPAEGAPIHVELTLETLKLGIADAESAGRDHGLEVTPGGRGAEVCLWTDDVATSFAVLLGVGATSMSEPHEWLDGSLRVAWVADPDGNPVELVQRLDRQVTGE